MKKIIGIILAVGCIFTFAACGKRTVDDGKALETAETYFEFTGATGSISVNETVARTLLEIYPKKVLGLSNELDAYTLKLSATRFSDSDACLVEAFPEKSGTAEGTFVILGQQCFVYNESTQKYLLLTLDGAVEYVPQNAESSTAEVFQYDKDNNERLQKKFSSYTKEQLGLKKEIGEYVLIASGTTTTAKDDKTVYIVRVYEKNGKFTNKTLAFNENGNYVFDYEANKYVEM